MAWTFRSAKGLLLFTILPSAAATVAPPEGYVPPVISKVQMVFSMVAHHHYLPSRINQYGGPTRHTRYAVPHLVYEPLVTLSNPGREALVLDGASAPRVRIWDTPVGFRFKRNNSYLRPAFANGEFQGLARFQVANENNANARKSFIVQTGGLDASGGPERHLSIEPNGSAMFAPWVEPTWNWEVETAGGFVPYAFYDWNLSKVFTWKDSRPALTEFGEMGFFCTPGWDPRAGFQADHLSNTSSGTGWVSALLTDTVSVEARAQRQVTAEGAADFQVDLLLGNDVSGALATVQELRISLEDLLQMETDNPGDPTASATFTVGDLLQTPPDLTPGGKTPFAVLSLIAKPAALRDGSLERLGTIENAREFYDLRFDAIERFEDVAAITPITSTPIPATVTVLGGRRSGEVFSFSYAVPEGAGPLVPFGGSGLEGMDSDLSGRTTLVQDPVESHVFTAHVDVSGLGPRYFIVLREPLDP